MSRFEKLKLGTRNTKNIKWPGTDEDVTLKILSNAEIQNAVFATERHFKAADMVVSTTTLDAYEDERTTQILFRALRNPDDIKDTFAPLVDDLRKQLTKDEKDALAAEYAAKTEDTRPFLTDAVKNYSFERIQRDIDEEVNALFKR